MVSPTLHCGSVCEVFRIRKRVLCAFRIPLHGKRRKKAVTVEAGAPHDAPACTKVRQSANTTITANRNMPIKVCSWAAHFCKPPPRCLSLRKKKPGLDRVQPRLLSFGFPSRHYPQRLNTGLREQNSPSMPKVCQNFCGFFQLIENKPLAPKYRSTARTRKGGAAY